MDAVLREERAAELLGLSPRTLQRFRVQGRGPRYIKLGKKVGYLERDLQEFIDKNRRQSTSEGGA